MKRSIAVTAIAVVTALVMGVMTSLVATAEWDYTTTLYDNPVCIGVDAGTRDCLKIDSSVSDDHREPTDTIRGSVCPAALVPDSLTQAAVRAIVPDASFSGGPGSWFIQNGSWCQYR